MKTRRRSGRRLPLASAALIILAALSFPSSAYYSISPGYVPVRQSLPNGVDMLESSLYWLQDLSGVDDPRDPASIVALMEDQAARFFDFAYIAYLVGGPGYARLDALERSHFQNRVRDRLFSLLAREMGMYNVRLPDFRPLVPSRSGTNTWCAGGVFYHPNGRFVQLIFHFYLSQRGWRIFDVLSNGRSLVASIRDNYRRNRGRGSFPAR